MVEVKVVPRDPASTLSRAPLPRVAGQGSRVHIML